MRKLILSLILLSASVLSHAGSPVCDMKRSEYERAQCYEYSVVGGMKRMKINYDRIHDASHVPQKEKALLAKQHVKWVEYAESKCSTDQCFYGFISKRNSEIERFMRHYGLSPM